MSTFKTCQSTTERFTRPFFGFCNVKCIKIIKFHKHFDTALALGISLGIYIPCLHKIYAGLSYKRDRAQNPAQIVTAWDRLVVTACDGLVVTTCDRLVVTTCYILAVTACDRLLVTACDRLLVTACDRLVVTAWDRLVVTAYDRLVVTD